MKFYVFIICFLASTIGGICGIGGGVIIKPVLDSLQIMSVSSISFLSGLSVLSMSIVSMLKQKNKRIVELRTGTMLAVGAIIGGFFGNTIFQQMKTLTQEETVGMVQAIVLAAITTATFIYSMFLRESLPSYRVSHPVAVVSLGILMGVLSAFLGIGGGPINLAILYFAFSMDTKKAAANSLYIIMFSQIANLCTYVFRNTIPEFDPTYLVLMVLAGMIGGILGSKINRQVSSAAVDRLFAGLLIAIVLICVYNAWRFAMLIPR